LGLAILVAAEAGAVVVAATLAEEVVAVERSRHLFRMARRGVTLLELLLALALSVIVLAAVGMAINLYFKMLDVRRTSIEEIQVVRIVTQRMTSDIRMIVQPNEPDLSGLQTAFQNSMQAASKQATATASTGTTVIGAGGTGGTSGATAGASKGGTGPPGNAAPPTTQPKANTPSNPQTPLALYGGSSNSQSGGGAGNAGGGQSAAGGASGGSSSGTGTGSTPQSAASSASTSSTTTPTIVKLVGSATELQFDISRIPRVDQYKGIVSGNGELSAVDLPSDVKTIAYYIRSDASAESLADDPNAPGGEASTDGYGRGLMRAEIDRAVASYAETGGGTASIYSSAQLLADEVVGLGFQYYDGTEALTEWDSATQGLPRAIRVWLSVKPRYGMSEKEIAQASAGKEPPSTDFYFIITLPGTPLVVPPADETTDTSSAASSSTSSSTGATP
jgi:prepilin-type N-terminal cleavage/methylation domain-containing protein